MRSKFKNLLNGQNNKGSTLVTVIIAISLVGILASLILIITQNSYVTKSVDSQSKNNFYSTEEVMDQLKLGLQNEIAASMVDAYYDVIVRFKDIEDPKKTFRELTLMGNGSKYGGFISKINDTSNPSRSNAVDVDKLNNLISDYYKTDDKYRLDVPKNSSAYILYSYDEEDFETITIRNIGVEYYNSVGYVNGLFTDIVITIPTPDFLLLDTDLDTEYEQFAIMARNNVELVQDNNTSDITGSAWIGDNVLLSGNNVKMKVRGDNVYIGENLNIGSGSSGGNYLFNSSKQDTSSNEQNLCLGNITINNEGSTANNAFYANANMYVKNDLVFDGNNSTVALAGSYHGIGISDEDPDASSAIIINGRNNTLSANGLREISVSGSSFIKTYKDDENPDYRVPSSQASILTGDSVSPRSNELAYLVPAKYMKGLPNPVTRSDLSAAGYSTSDGFNKLTDDINTILDSSDLAKSSGSGGPIIAKFRDESGKESYVRVLHYTYSDSTDTSEANSKSVAYYYLNFVSARTAAKFYEDENNVSEPVKKMLLGLIPVTMNLSSSNFNVVGVNVKHLVANSSGLVSKTIETGDLEPGNISFIQKNEELFENVKTFLTPETSEISDKLKDVAEKLSYKDKGAINIIIDWDELAKDHTSGCILDEGDYGDVLQYYVKDNCEYRDIPLRARIYNGNKELTPSDLGNKAYYGIIISTGNITLKGNVEIHGLVIAGGNVYIENGSTEKANLIADPGAVRDIFNRAGLVHTKGGVYLDKILRGYEVKKTDYAENKVHTISLDNMFTYENWSKN